MRLVFTADHAGYKMREALATWAADRGHEIVQVGAQSEVAYDYPIAADQGVHELFARGADFGVFVCGSGIGISIRANRHPGIRAAHCLTVPMAVLARQHNHANVLCLGEREIEQDLAERILETFLATAPDDAERHVRRVGELDDALEEGFERTN